jgi:hypothetical protein
MASSNFLSTIRLGRLYCAIFSKVYTSPCRVMAIIS